MREDGQVFTFDMLLAIILMMLAVVSSGQALSMANEQASEYVSRYSLERKANDIADVLVRSSGKPRNWENNFDDLKTPGFAMVKYEEESPNYLDLRKIYRFAAEIQGDDWNPEGEPCDEAIREAFGDNKFEITIEKGKFSWTFWPGKESDETPPRSKSLEVASVERLVYGTFADARGETGPMGFTTTGNPIPPFWGDNKFWVGPEEKEDYDWYVYAENVGPDILSSWVNIGVNDKPQRKHVRFKSNEDIPGSKQIDPTHLIENTTNYISIHGGDADMDKVNFYVVALLPGQDPVDIPSMLKERPYNLKVKIWR